MNVDIIKYIKNIIIPTLATFIKSIVVEGVRIDYKRTTNAVQNLISFSLVASSVLEREHPHL